MRDISRLIFIQILMFVVGLACVEFALRYFMPLPGTGTFDQIRILKYAIDTYNIQPA